jgi:hypothetical protein
MQLQDDALYSGFGGALKLVSHIFHVKKVLVVLQVVMVVGYVVVKLAYFRVLQFLVIFLCLLDFFPVFLKALS